MRTLDHLGPLRAREIARLALLLTLVPAAACQDSDAIVEPRTEYAGGTTANSLGNPPPANGTTTRVTLEPTDTLRVGPLGADATFIARAWAGTQEVATPIRWWNRTNRVAALSATTCTAPCSITVKAKALGTTLVDIHEYVKGSTAERDQAVVIVVDSAPTGGGTTLAQVIVKPETAALSTGGTQQFAAYGRMSNGDSTTTPVTWSGTGGTISASGVYTAGTAAGTFRVIATAEGKADTALVTVTSTPPPPPPTGVATCFDAGAPTLTVSGTFPVNTTYNRASTVPAGARIDASGASWSKNSTSADYIVRIGTGANICWHGGRVLGLWNQATEPWETYHSSNGFTGNGSNMTVENWRAENYGDGVKWLELATNWTVRRTHLVDIHDDCIETDWMEGGRVEDVLFEGCYTFIATRPRSSLVGIVDGRDDTITVDRAVVWHKKVAHGYNGRLNDVGGLFKIDTYHTPAWGPYYVIRNSVVRVGPEATGSRSCLNPQGLVVRAENNIVVWTGSGDYPCLPIPPGWTLTRDIGVYENAVAAWKSRHPGM